MNYYSTGGSTFKQTGYYNTGFVEHGHVVFLRGLSTNNDRPHANPYAVTAATRVASQFFNNPSLNPNSAYSRLLNYLWTIQRREAEKEKAYLTMKLEKLRQNLAPSFYNLIKKTFDEGNFSAAYTLIMKTKTDIEELKRELNSSFRSFQKDNSVWENDFSTFLFKELSKRLENTGDMIRLVEGAPDASIESLVEDFITQVLGTDTKNIIIPELEKIKKIYKEGLFKVFSNAGLTYGDVNSWDMTAPLFSDRDKDYRGLSKKSELTYKTKRGNRRYTLRSLINGIAMEIAKGISGELANLKLSAGPGAFSLHVGDMTKGIENTYTGKTSEVKRKVDVMTFEVARMDVDVGGIVRGVMEAASPDEDQIESIEKALENSLEDMDIFEVSTNIKTYKSKRDLQIEGENDFTDRLSNLKNIAAKAKGIPNNTFEKLIFLLNNTVSGCIAAGREDEIGDYIAAVYSAWMWDDYEDMFSIETKPAGRIKKIHIFNSGGAYFTASDMMAQLINNLESIHSGSTSTENQFIKVNITAPTFDTSYYDTLVKTFPIEGMNTYAEKQEQLAHRWNAVTAEVMPRGKIAIYVKQQDIEKLLGNLADLIRNA